MRVTVHCNQPGVLLNKLYEQSKLCAPCQVGRLANANSRPCRLCSALAGSGCIARGQTPRSISSRLPGHQSVPISSVFSSRKSTGGRWGIYAELVGIDCSRMRHAVQWSLVTNGARAAAMRSIPYCVFSSTNMQELALTKTSGSGSMGRQSRLLWYSPDPRHLQPQCLCPVRRLYLRSR